jgi:hypothetical protein
MSELENLIDTITATKNALKNDAQRLLLAYFKDKLPVSVNAVRWTQYSPHFNDGEPCTFRVNEPYFNVEGVDEDSEGWYEEYDGFYSRSYKNDGAADVKAFEKLFGSIPDEVYEYAFGDGYQITIRRADGSLLVSVDWCDHD